MSEDEKDWCAVADGVYADWKADEREEELKQHHKSEVMRRCKEAMESVLLEQEGYANPVYIEKVLAEIEREMEKEGE